MRRWETHGCAVKDTGGHIEMKLVRFYAVENLYQMFYKTFHRIEIMLVALNRSTKCFSNIFALSRYSRPNTNVTEAAAANINDALVGNAPARLLRNFTYLGPQLLLYFRLCRRRFPPPAAAISVTCMFDCKCLKNSTLDGKISLANTM